MDDAANLNINIAGAQTISLNQAITIGTLNLGDTGSSYYGVTLANGTGGSLIFDVGSGNAAIAKAASSNTAADTISATITLNDNLDISNAATNGGLTVSGNIGDGGAAKSINKLGAGTLTLTGTNTFSGGMNILNGTVSLSTNNSAGTGTITLGDSSGSNNATLFNGGAAGSLLLITNNISVAAGSSGTLSILGNNNNITNSGSLTLGNNLTVSSGNVGKTVYFTGTTTETSLTPLTITNINSLTTFTGPLVISSGGLTFAHNTTVVLIIGPGNISGTGSLTFNANSSGAFTVSAASINNSGSITNGGAGSGATTISGAIGSSVGAIVQNSATSQLTLSGANGSSSWPIYIKAGTVYDNGTSGSLGTGIITLGDDTPGNNNSATLQTGLNAPASNNPIVVQAGSSGTLAIYNSIGQNATLPGAITLNNNLMVKGYDGVGVNRKTLKLSGNISGTGNITIVNNQANGAQTYSLVELAGASINFIGAITNTGTCFAGNNVTISGPIGTNVTAVVQNSATSALILSGTNNYTGPTAINAGTVIISGSGKLGNGNYEGAISNNGALVYSNTAVQTLGGVISGSGTLTQ